MKEIQLTQGKVALVDDEDFEWLSKWKWHQTTLGYTQRGEWDWVKKKNNLIWMHREIMNCPADRRVDHIDGNKLNNQRGNLRICTSSQNNKNRTKGKHTSSRFKGVCYVKNTGKWTASICNNYNESHLGHYHTEEAAALAYNRACQETDSEFYIQNKLSEAEMVIALSEPQYQKPVYACDFNGVTFEGGKWRARITINKKRIYVGRFDSPQKAANAIQEALTWKRQQH